MSLSQEKLLLAIQTAPTAQARANLMRVLAKSGDEGAILPMLKAIDTRALIHNGTATNEGNKMLEAVFAVCQRHKDSAQEYLLEVLNEPKPTSTKFLAVIFDKDYIAAIARREAAAEIMARLYSGESLADELFANAKKGKQS